MSNCPRNFRDGILAIVDNTPTTPNKLIIPVMDGNLTWTEHTPKAMVMNRGKLYSRRAGNEQEVDVSFDVTFTQLVHANGSSGVSVRDALTKTGGASAWVSTDTVCDVYAVDLFFQMLDPEDQTKTEQVTISKFSPDTLKFAEGDPNKLTVSGKAFSTKVVSVYGALVA